MCGIITPEMTQTLLVLIDTLALPQQCNSTLEAKYLSDRLSKHTVVYSVVIGRGALTNNVPRPLTMASRMLYTHKEDGKHDVSSLGRLPHHNDVCIF